MVISCCICHDCALPAQNTSAQIDFSGLDGKGIAAKIAAEYRPLMPPKTIEELREAVAEYASMPEGGFIDFFSTSNSSTISNLDMLAVAPTSWWSERSEDYNLIAMDLHNIVPANKLVSSVRNDFPPGTVIQAAYDNGYWKSGIGGINGQETNFYEPPDRYKGDLARIYMYMSAVYPQALWHSRGVMIYVDGGYPLLTQYGRETLMKWHREDPVDAFELARNAVISKRQGFGNPFVEQPLLCEYIWGKYSGETLKPDPGTDPGDDDGPLVDPTPEPILLKALYSKSVDGRIDFQSPYVSSDSQWSFDGSIVNARSISLDGIGLGKHVISFSNKNAKGKIIITVEP